jgi:hypothetical protein
MKAPAKPLSDGIQETHVKAEMYEGIANGIEKSTVQATFPRIPDNDVTHAAKTPMTTAAIVTAAHSRTLRTSSSVVRFWKISSKNGVAPREVACTTR